MSGGVDSSVAACLLKAEGYDVVGVTMKLWNDEEAESQRPAGPVQGMLHPGRHRGRPPRVPDNRRAPLRDELPAGVPGARHRLFSAMSICGGRTPHPCLACNDKIKFDFLMKKAAALDIDYIATGHYARLEASDGGVRLLKGIDASKDQSYVLFNLRPHQSERLLLPVGWHSKKAIRDIARAEGLPVADKPGQPGDMLHPPRTITAPSWPAVSAKPRRDCGRVRLSAGAAPGRSGIHRRAEARPGYSHPAADVRAEHRRGFQPRCGRAGGGPDAEQPLGQRRQLPVGALRRRSLWTWTPRYATRPASLRPRSSPTNGWAEVRFREPQRAVTPGQAVVFYQGDEVLGGGYIEGALLGSGAAAAANVSLSSFKE